MRSKSHVSSTKKTSPKRKAAAVPTQALAAAPKVEALPGPKAVQELAAAADPVPGEDVREATLARVEAVRLAQREEGNFDCFGRAEQGYCDQGGCTYHAECLSVSHLLHDM